MHIFSSFLSVFKCTYEINGLCSWLHEMTVNGSVITKLRLHNRLLTRYENIFSWIGELERKNSNTVNRMLPVSGAILVSARVAMVTISWEMYSQSKGGKEILQTACARKRRVEWHCVSGFTRHTSANPKAQHTFYSWD